MAVTRNVDTCGEMNPNGSGNVILYGVRNWEQKREGQYCFYRHEKAGIYLGEWIDNIPVGISVVHDDRHWLMEHRRELSRNVPHEFMESRCTVSSSQMQVSLVPCELVTYQGHQ